jgi:hypothetical protein
MYDRALHEAHQERGLFLGSLVLALLIAPHVYLLFNPSQVALLSTPQGAIFNGAYVLLIGCTFLGSYYFSHKSFIFRWFAWICEHWSFPASRKMAFFYFGLSLLLAGIAVTQGLTALGAEA